MPVDVFAEYYTCNASHINISYFKRDKLQHINNNFENVLSFQRRIYRIYAIYEFVDDGTENNAPYLHRNEHKSILDPKV